MCDMKSTPIPTETINMTAGTALSLIPSQPIRPNSSIIIIIKTTTIRVAVQGLRRKALITRNTAANTTTSAENR